MICRQMNQGSSLDMGTGYWLSSLKAVLTFQSYSCIQNTNVTVKQGEGESIRYR